MHCSALPSLPASCSQDPHATCMHAHVRARFVHPAPMLSPKAAPAPVRQFGLVWTVGISVMALGLGFLFTVLPVHLYRWGSTLGALQHAWTRADRLLLIRQRAAVSPCPTEQPIPMHRRRHLCLPMHAHRTRPPLPMLRPQVLALPPRRRRRRRGGPLGEQRRRSGGGLHLCERGGSAVGIHASRVLRARHAWPGGGRACCCHRPEVRSPPGHQAQGPLSPALPTQAGGRLTWPGAGGEEGLEVAAGRPNLVEALEAAGVAAEGGAVGVYLAGPTGMVRPAVSIAHRLNDRRGGPYYDVHVETTEM